MTTFDLSSIGARGRGRRKIEATNGGRNADTKVERRAGKKLVLPNTLLRTALTRSTIFLMERPLLVFPSALLYKVLTYFNIPNGPPSSIHRLLDVCTFPG